MFISRGTQAGCGVLQSIPARSAKPLHLSLLRNELLSSIIIFLLDSIAETNHQQGSHDRTRTASGSAKVIEKANQSPARSCLKELSFIVERGGKTCDNSE